MSPSSASRVGRSALSRGLVLAWGLLIACEHAPTAPAIDRDFCDELDDASPPGLSSVLEPLRAPLAGKTGVHVLELGGTAMASRAWLSQAAERSIDTQYFIFSSDNVGMIGMDYLLRAAQRGVEVRVLVDDLLVEADVARLAALDAHAHLSIKVYNPNVNIGKSLGERATKIVTDFRGVNQRMHNKTFIVDGEAVITGGRNIADEYFDFDQCTASRACASSPTHPARTRATRAWAAEGAPPTPSSS